MTRAEPLLVGLGCRVILRAFDDKEDTGQEHGHENQYDESPDDHPTVDVS